MTDKPGKSETPKTKLLGSTSHTAIGEKLQRKAEPAMQPVDEKLVKLTLMRNFITHILDEGQPQYHTVRGCSIDPAACIRIPFNHTPLANLLKDIKGEDRTKLLEEIAQVIKQALFKENDTESVLKTQDFKSIKVETIEGKYVLVFGEAYDAKEVLIKMRELSSRLLIDKELVKRFDPIQTALSECKGRA